MKQGRFIALGMAILTSIAVCNSSAADSKPKSAPTKASPANNAQTRKAKPSLSPASQLTSYEWRVIRSIIAKYDKDKNKVLNATERASMSAKDRQLLTRTRLQPLLRARRNGAQERSGTTTKSSRAQPAKKTANQNKTK